MSRIDLLDPLVVRVNSEEFAPLLAAYAKIGCTADDVGDGIVLIMAGEEGVVARFRVDRSQ